MLTTLDGSDRSSVHRSAWPACTCLLATCFSCINHLALSPRGIGNLTGGNRGTHVRHSSLRLTALIPRGEKQSMRAQHENQRRQSNPKHKQGGHTSEGRDSKCAGRRDGGGTRGGGAPSQRGPKKRFKGGRRVSRGGELPPMGGGREATAPGGCSSAQEWDRSTLEGGSRGRSAMPERLGAERRLPCGACHRHTPAGRPPTAATKVHS